MVGTDESIELIAHEVWKSCNADDCYLITGPEFARLANSKDIFMKQEMQVRRMPFELLLIRTNFCKLHLP